MVEVAVSASLKVAGGPALSLSATLEPESYTFARVRLAKAGDADAEHELPLLPDGGDVAVLGVSVRADKDAAAVTLTPKSGSKSGTALELTGSLLVAHPGVLAALVAGGPRSILLKNTGAQPTTVEVLTGRV